MNEKAPQKPKISNYLELLISEYKLIIAKKSKLSRMKRDLVISQIEPLINSGKITL